MGILSGLFTGLTGQSLPQRVVDENGRYDLKRFSRYEEKAVWEVLHKVDRKYPAYLRSIGLAEESYPVVYKPRYVLFDIIIVKYGKSQNPIDKIAVAFAYESKGAYFRKEAISYFEDAIKTLDISSLKAFSAYSPAQTYMKFSELYDKEHDYQSALFLLKKSRALKGANKAYIDEEIKKLEKKIKNPPKTRRSKKPDYYDDFERDVRRAAIAFVTGDFSGIELNARPNK